MLWTGREAARWAGVGRRPSPLRRVVWHAGAEEVEEGEFVRGGGDQRCGAMLEWSRGLRRAAATPPNQIPKKTPDPSGSKHR